MEYQPTENYDVLLGLGLTPATCEALDRLLQDAFVDELSSALLEKFTQMDESASLACIEKIRSIVPQDIDVGN